MSRSVRTRCKGHSTACGCWVCAQLTARRQAFLIRSTSSKIWAFAGLFITRPALSHYLSTRREIDAGAKSLFAAVAQGVLASNVVKTFPLREAAEAHKFIAGRKTTGSIVMLPFE